MSLSNYLWSRPVTGLASMRNSPTTVLRPYVLVRADVKMDAIAPPHGSNGHTVAHAARPTCPRTHDGHARRSAGRGLGPVRDPGASR